MSDIAPSDDGRRPRHSRFARFLLCMIAGIAVGSGCVPSRRIEIREVHLKTFSDKEVVLLTQTDVDPQIYRNSKWADEVRLEFYVDTNVPVEDPGKNFEPDSNDFRFPFVGYQTSPTWTEGELFCQEWTIGVQDEEEILDVLFRYDLIDGREHKLTFEINGAVFFSGYVESNIQTIRLPPRPQ